MVVLQAVDERGDFTAAETSRVVLLLREDDEQLLLHPIAAQVWTVAVTDLVDGETVSDEDTAVALVPAVAIGDQVQPAKRGRQGLVQVVIESEVGTGCDEPQERRVPLEGNRPARF